MNRILVTGICILLGVVLGPLNLKAEVKPSSKSAGAKVEALVEQAQKEGAKIVRRNKTARSVYEEVQEENRYLDDGSVDIVKAYDAQTPEYKAVRMVLDLLCARVLQAFKGEEIPQKAGLSKKACTTRLDNSLLFSGAVSRDEYMETVLRPQLEELSHGPQYNLFLDTLAGIFYQAPTSIFPTHPILVWEEIMGNKEKHYVGIADIVDEIFGARGGKDRNEKKSSVATSMGSAVTYAMVTTGSLVVLRIGGGIYGGLRHSGKLLTTTNPSLSGALWKSARHLRHKKQAGDSFRLDSVRHEGKSTDILVALKGKALDLVRKRFPKLSQSQLDDEVVSYFSQLSQWVQKQPFAKSVEIPAANALTPENLMRFLNQTAQQINRASSREGLPTAALTQLHTKAPYFKLPGKLTGKDAVDRADRLAREIARGRSNLSASEIAERLKTEWMPHYRDYPVPGMEKFYYLKEILGYKNADFQKGALARELAKFEGWRKDLFLRQGTPNALVRLLSTEAEEGILKRYGKEILMAVLIPAAAGYVAGQLRYNSLTVHGRSYEFRNVYSVLGRKFEELLEKFYEPEFKSYLLRTEPFMESLEELKKDNPRVALETLKKTEYALAGDPDGLVLRMALEAFKMKTFTVPEDEESVARRDDELNWLYKNYPGSLEGVEEAESTNQKIAEIQEDQLEQEALKGADRMKKSLGDLRFPISNTRILMTKAAYRAQKVLALTSERAEVLIGSIEEEIAKDAEKEAARLKKEEEVKKQKEENLNKVFPHPESGMQLF